MTTTKPTLPDVLRALADGKRVEFYQHADWYPFRNNSYYRLECFSEFQWRIVEPPPPPKTIPLGPEDVPPGSVFRLPEWVEYAHRNYYQTGITGVFWSPDNEVGYSWAALRNAGWLIKRPGEEWTKCEKLAALEKPKD